MDVPEQLPPWQGKSGSLFGSRGMFGCIIPGKKNGESSMARMMNENVATAMAPVKKRKRPEAR